MHAYRNNLGKEFHSDGIPELLTVKQAGKYLGIGKEFYDLICDLVQRGILPPVQSTGRWRISRLFLDQKVVPLFVNRSKTIDSCEEWIQLAVRRFTKP